MHGEEEVFGNLLARYRTQSRMSQQRLADCLGVHRNTIAKWESQGTLPKNRTRIEEVARCLKLPDFQRDALLKAALLDAFPHIWNVPYQRNPHFTGREALLEQLDHHLSLTGGDASIAPHRTALTQPQAIKGLGGIGKTQIAIEYAYRSRERAQFIHTFWVNAASAEALLTDFIQLAAILPSFPEKHETDHGKLLEGIKRWLERCQERWLLIFDNADDISLIQAHLPQRGNGSVLLTTRASAVGSLATSLDVDTMGFMEGTQLLLRRAQRFDQATDEEMNKAGNIVVALDHFPLAIDQAGAYIEETQCLLSHYLEIFQSHRRALLARRGIQANQYPDSVATTWSLSFQKVEQENPAAAELLRLCALLAPDRIPEELLTDGASYWSPLLKEAATNALAYNHMIAALLKFSLVKRRAENATLSIHRLVQAIQEDSMEPGEQRHWAERIVRAVHHGFPQNPKEASTAWPQCLRYLEQAQMCDTLIQHYQFVFPEAADLLNRTGIYLYEHATYTLAQSLYQRAIHICEQLGPESAHAASPLNNLAHLYTESRDQKKYAEAEALYQQALESGEQRLRSDALQQATSLTGLAFLYHLSHNHHKYAAAEHLYQQGISIREHYLGSEHPDVADALNGLAYLYHEQGKYAEAEPLYQRALQICEQCLGVEHLDVARPLNNLAYLYHEQGNYAEAGLLYQRALHICELHLEPEHPLMAYALNNLANLFCTQSRYKEAEPLYQRAIHIWQILGAEYAQITYPMNNLANLYRELGKYEEAKSLYQQALFICEQHLGPEHPDVAIALHGLALLYHEQGNYAAAEPLYHRTLYIREQQFGPEHLDVARRLLGLANLYREQGKHTEAEPLYQRALRIWQRLFGRGHPQVAALLTGLANLYRDQAHFAEAEVLYQEALQISERALGSHHPDRAEVMYQLARLQEAQGLGENARQWYRRALAIHEESLGKHHPKTLRTRAQFIALLDSLGDAQAATQLRED